jgi:hypothetical protein
VRRRLGDWRARWRCTLPGCPLEGAWQTVEVPVGGDAAKAGDDALAAHYAREHREERGEAR